MKKNKIEFIHEKPKQKGKNKRKRKRKQIKGNHLNIIYRVYRQKIHMGIVGIVGAKCVTRN